MRLTVAGIDFPLILDHGISMCLNFHIALLGDFLTKRSLMRIYASSILLLPSPTYAHHCSAYNWLPFQS